jgi:hypothetical protein
MHYFNVLLFVWLLQCWYLFGTLGAALCYFMVFGECLPCLSSGPVSQTGLVVYYCIAASLFNVGWAAVQACLLDEFVQICFTCSVCESILRRPGQF